MEEVEVDRICSIHGGDEKFIQNLVRNLKKEAVFVI
jgi:hypothetical protein